MPEKVLFLDVDGVLNNGNWAMEMYEKGVRVYRDDMLCVPSLRELSRLVEATGARIVVSSSWRLDAERYDHLRKWLAAYGMRVYDATPDTGGIRGDDIGTWLSRHPGVRAYAILDDEDDMDEHMARLVKTSFAEGLTRERAEACMRLLMEA